MRIGKKIAGSGSTDVCLHPDSAATCFNACTLALLLRKSCKAGWAARCWLWHIHHRCLPALRKCFERSVPDVGMSAPLCWTLASLQLAAQPDASTPAPSPCEELCTRQTPTAAGNKGMTAGMVFLPQDNSRCTALSAGGSGVQVAGAGQPVACRPSAGGQRLTLGPAHGGPHLQHPQRPSAELWRSQHACGHGPGQSLAAGTLRLVDIHNRGGGAGMQA